MELQQCPYDGAAIEAESYSGGSIVLTCPDCGAAWEWHNALVWRIREPDRDTVRSRRADRGGGPGAAPARPSAAQPPVRPS